VRLSQIPSDLLHPRFGLRGEAFQGFNFGVDVPEDDRVPANRFLVINMVISSCSKRNAHPHVGFSKAGHTIGCSSESEVGSITICRRILRNVHDFLIGQPPVHVKESVELLPAER